MWKMTLKQRRRHSELISNLDKLRHDPYARVPAGYTHGENPDEDEKYNKVFVAVKSIVEELQQLEIAVRDGD